MSRNHVSRSKLQYRRNKTDSLKKATGGILSTMEYLQRDAEYAPLCAHSVDCRSGLDQTRRDWSQQYRTTTLNRIIVLPGGGS